MGYWAPSFKERADTLKKIFYLIIAFCFKRNDIRKNDTGSGVVLDCIDS